MNITVKTVHVCRFTDRYYLWNNRFSVLSQKFCPFKGFLDLLNVFHTCKNTGTTVYKFMSIQIQEEHIGHVEQSKSDIFQDHSFLYHAKYGCKQIFPKNENLTLTVVFMYSYVISLSCTFSIDKNHQTKA